MSESFDREGFVRFFDRIAEQRAGVEADVEEVEYELQVIETSRPATPADASTSILRTLAWLTLCGWWSASQVTRVFQPGQEFKSGSRAGESRPDKEMTNFFIHAAHPDRRTLTAWYIDGKLNAATVSSSNGVAHVVERVGDLDTHIEVGL